jgi:phage shock protein E
MRHIIDVREPLEYMMGHVSAATNIPLSKITTHFEQSTKDFDKDDEIIVYCGSGNRAGMAAELFIKHGYTHVVNGVNQQSVEKNHLAG